jgi:alkanesulfonate monooxygenase SsuD/methylene tetrahydromethanopterin reductase-like flavin-dependent oxidoreductase (luciferase family)
MRAFHFTEQPYPDAWDEPSVRIEIPNKLCDPQVAGDLYNRYYDEWMIADELGLDVMVNEHHSTATCLSASANVALAILARQTKRARILALGVPLGNRPDPLRVAEELSMVDVISRGRLEMGFVKGVPYETPIVNLNPSQVMDRLWEAHDLVLKAMTTHDGPFRWEGEHFQYRTVNIWPRPWQQPHPPVWVTALSPTSAPAIAKRGHVIATLLGGYGAKTLFDVYRKTYAEVWCSQPARDRFGYAAFVAVGSNEAEARRRGEILLSYLVAGNRSPTHFKAPPGYFGAEAIAGMWRDPNKEQTVQTLDGRAVPLRSGRLDDLMAAGVIFCGTPDQVFHQVTTFDQHVGGFGNLLMMGQAGALGHADTVASMTLFAQEVLPRLRQHAALVGHAAA